RSRSCFRNSAARRLYRRDLKKGTRSEIDRGENNNSHNMPFVFSASLHESTRVGCAATICLPDGLANAEANLSRPSVTNSPASASALPKLDAFDVVGASEKARREYLSPNLSKCNFRMDKEMFRSVSNLALACSRFAILVFEAFTSSLLSAM